MAFSVPGASRAAASSLSVWTPCRTWTTTVPTAKLSWAPTSVCRTQPDLKGAVSCREAAPTLHPAPAPVEGSWWSHVSRGSTFVSSFGGKMLQKSYTSKPQKWLLGVMHRHAKTFSLSAGSRVFCLPPPPDCDPKPFHLAVIVVLSEYLLVICHWLASFLASVGLSFSGLQIRSPRLPYF